MVQWVRKVNEEIMGLQALGVHLVQKVKLVKWVYLDQRVLLVYLVYLD
jgi:hypothetical protein